MARPHRKNGRAVLSSLRKAYLGRSCGKYPIGRPECHRMDREESDSRELHAYNGQETAQNKKKWNVFISGQQTFSFEPTELGI